MFVPGSVFGRIVARATVSGLSVSQSCFCIRVIAPLDLDLGA
jgi:hypothetical protein